jgi:trans-L-3-hydroxyproline dehydratase
MMRTQRLFTAIDAHAGGQPLRILTSGVPPLQGATLLEKRADLASNHDDIRRLLLHEPRGHADMYGAVLTAPHARGADYGVIFMTNEGYSSMCGHGIIALATALIETGAFPTQGPETRITFETPVGLVQARASVDQGVVRAVRFRNVPAFRLAKEVDIQAWGRGLQVDVAFGGAWYAIARAADLGLDLAHAAPGELAAAGMAVKRAASAAMVVEHPVEPDLRGLYGTIITGPASASDITLRNATVYADGAIDRSPCGTGTSALVACRAADGELAVGDTLVNESITGSIFSGRIVMATTVGDMAGVITEISGRGAVTGLHQFMVNRDDPMPEGFLIRTHTGVTPGDEAE